MSYYTERRRSVLYSPAARASNEAVDIMTVKKGDRVTLGLVQKRVLSSTANTVAFRISAGAGGQAGGIIAAFSTSSGTVGDLLNCVGADMTAGGFLCTADGTIQATYTAVGGGGTATPVVRLNLGIMEHEQIN